MLARVSLFSRCEFFLFLFLEIFNYCDFVHEIRESIRKNPFHLQLCGYRTKKKSFNKRFFISFRYKHTHRRAQAHTHTSDSGNFIDPFSSHNHRVTRTNHALAHIRGPMNTISYSGVSISLRLLERRLVHPLPRVCGIESWSWCDRSSFYHLNFGRVLRVSLLPALACVHWRVPCASSIRNDNQHSRIALQW